MANDEPWTRVAAHGLCMAEDALLLVRLASPLEEAGRWGLPGGGIEWGESPEAALVRELREETGLDVRARGVAGTFSATYPSSDQRTAPLHFLSILYWVEVLGGELTAEVGGTTDQVAWVPLAEVASLPVGVLAAHGLSLLPERPR